MFFHQDYGKEFHLNDMYFFYKQVALGWQIPRQLSKLTPCLLSNNKNYQLRKRRVFLCNEQKTVLKLTIQKRAFGKSLKSLITNTYLNPENYCIPRRHWSNY